MTQVTALMLTNAALDCDTIADVATSTAETVTDRLGGVKRTLTGAILALGYEPPVAYAAALNMTNGAQTVEYDGAIYAAKPSEVPFTTSGTFESAKFRLLDSSTATVQAAASAASALAAEAAADAAAETAKFGVPSILSSTESLALGTTGDTTVKVYCASAVLRDSTNTPLRISDIAAGTSASIASSGVGGLDTGTEANSTYYYIWLISDAATTRALLSVSSTAPTMPVGYTYKLLVGAVYNNASGHFQKFQQSGVHVIKESTTLLSAGTATTYTNVSLTGHAPPNARRVSGTIEVGSASAASISAYVAAETSSPGFFSVGEIYATTISAGAGTPDMAVPFAINSQHEGFHRIQYKVAGTGASANIYVSGFSY
ncbi:MAG: hypothetical protein WA154_11180 [Moraxellaceae bacterium]